MRYSRYGHQFTWMDTSDNRFGEPPPQTPCSFCGETYAKLEGNVHTFCVGRFSQDPGRIAFVQARQGQD